jgi:hypothetical protein
LVRKHPWIDRLASEWIIKRFIDPSPEFLYVPVADVMKIAAETGAIPYDVKGVELGHRGDRCSFDGFMEKYSLTGVALTRLAEIVRAADTGRLEAAPEATGLLAISRGLSVNFRDDHEMLKHGMVMYDALCAACGGDIPSTSMSSSRRES